MQKLVESLLCLNHHLSLSIVGNFTNNTASYEGGVMYSVSTLEDPILNIVNYSFTNISNSASDDAIIFILGTTVSVENCEFFENVGSLNNFYAFCSNITFQGYTTFVNCNEPPPKHANKEFHQGGAVTSYHSTVTFFKGVAKHSTKQPGKRRQCNICHRQ